MKIKTRDMIIIAMFTALTAIGGFLKIPTQPVPFTLQFLFCAYAGLLLGSKYGFLSQLLYIVIGLAGVPIFAKGGGVSYVFQPTFGYLIGFMLCAYLVGKLTEKMKEVTFIKVFAFSFIGLNLVYLVGIPYLYTMINRVAETPITFMTAIKLGYIPFILQDLIKCILIALTSVRIIPHLRKNGYGLF